MCESKCYVVNNAECQICPKEKKLWCKLAIGKRIQVANL